MIVEILKEKNKELIKTVLENYTSDIQSEEYNKLINSIFSLADFIVANKNGEYVDFHEVKKLSALYVLREIGEFVESGNYEYEMDFLRHCADIGGRLRESLNLADSFLNTKEGTMEILKNGSLMSGINFLKS